MGRDCEGAVVDDPEVSRRHLTLSHPGGVLAVTDLGGANGFGRSWAATPVLDHHTTVTYPPCVAF